MKTYVLSIGLILFTVMACQSPKEKALKDIDTLEASDTSFSVENSAKLKDAYLDFANKYPDDINAPEFLFKAGQRMSVLASENNNAEYHKESIAIFEKICKTYPENHFAEEAMFLSAYVYENSLKDTDKARMRYESFIDKYPNSELKEDAELAIKNLGIDPAEVIRKAQEANQAP